MALCKFLTINNIVFFFFIKKIMSRVAMVHHVKFLCAKLFSSMPASRN